MGCKIQKQPPEVFYKKGVLQNSTKFNGKHLCRFLVFSKDADLRPQTCSFMKKRLWRRGFPVNFAKFFKNTFFTKHLRVSASENHVAVYWYLMRLLAEYQFVLSTSFNHFLAEGNKLMKSVRAFLNSFTKSFGKHF